MSNPKRTLAILEELANAASDIKKEAEMADEISKRVAGAMEDFGQSEPTDVIKRITRKVGKQPNQWTKRKLEIPTPATPVEVKPFEPYDPNKLNWDDIYELEKKQDAMEQEQWKKMAEQKYSKPKKTKAGPMTEKEAGKELASEMDEVNKQFGPIADSIKLLSEDEIKAYLNESNTTKEFQDIIMRIWNEGRKPTISPELVKPKTILRRK